MKKKMQTNNYIFLMLESCKYKYKSSILKGCISLIDILTNEKTILKFLNNYSTPNEEKKEIIDTLFKENHFSIFSKVFWAMIDFNDFNSILNVLKQFHTAYQTYTNAGIIKIYSPFPIKKSKANEIARTISLQTKVSYMPKVIIDKSLIGGCLISGPNFTIDFSISKKLKELNNIINGYYET